MSKSGRLPDEVIEVEVAPEFKDRSEISRFFEIGQSNVQFLIPKLVVQTVIKTDLPFNR